MTSNKHIALLYTGGTIGMQATAQGYAPMPDFPDVLSTLLDQADGLPRYTLYPYGKPIDSSNATPADWQTVGRDIAARYDGHDGFVVLHGTDTMAYTASALSFMLRGLRKPVIVTGSQIPLKAPRSDALQNLVTSLQFACSDAISEVAVYFNQRLLRGNRCTKMSTEHLQAFDTPNYPWLGEQRIQLRLDHHALLPRADAERFELPDYGRATVLSLRFLPGMPLQVLKAMLDLRPQALILQCYGAGNAPDRDPALIDMLARASGEGTVLVGCSQAPFGAVTIGAYAAGAEMTRAGVVSAGDMSFEAIYAKLHHLFALGLEPGQVRLAFAQDRCGEISA
ncbi:asparaginase [Noviherbaspirillum galbum]|uniref:Asparaginase n=1 Tax=Noviherbaspirillum galbum TaxID=2709383 RepID=A0A6B3SKV6_9BURK|nr:asparaginase [Noviherbaspirillum galbum]NEX61400.1 asparaginase [Noviherbaspirillum galbum]